MAATRLVLNLDRMLPYQTRVAGNKIIVTLGEAARAAGRSTDRGPATASRRRRGARPHAEVGARSRTSTSVAAVTAWAA
jgi:hypothetical protein